MLSFQVEGVRLLYALTSSVGAFHPCGPTQYHGLFPRIYSAAGL